MKTLQPIPLEFRNGPDGPVPVDPSLYSMAVQYCQENLAEMPVFRNYVKTYVEAEVGEHGEIIAVHGVACVCYRPDVTVFRATGPHANRATSDLYRRLNGFLSDNGWRGQEAFIFIAEKETPEQRCEAWQQSLEDVGAKPAQRFAVVVK